MATVFCNVYGVLLVGFAPVDSTINAAAYQGTLRETHEAYSAKETKMLTKGILLLHNNTQPHSAATAVNFLTSWGWEIFPHPLHSPDLHCCTSIFSQRWKSTSEVSTSTPMKIFEVKSRNGYVPRMHFFSEGLDKLIYSYDKCLNRLGDYVEK
jgi:hypothetical protein